MFRDIEDRAFAFACRILRFAERLATLGRIPARIAVQLVDAGTSVGANLQEAHAGQSKRDFIARTVVSLKEAREVRYWLRLANACYTEVQQEGGPLASEATEIIRVLTAIVAKARTSPWRG